MQVPKPVGDFTFISYWNKFPINLATCQHLSEMKSLFNQFSFSFYSSPCVRAEIAQFNLFFKFGLEECTYSWVIRFTEIIIRRTKNEASIENDMLIRATFFLNWIIASQNLCSHFLNINTTFKFNITASKLHQYSRRVC